MIRSTAALVLFLSSLATAADVTGNWKLSYTTENGLTREANLDLKVEGDHLAGTLSSDRGSARIEDGKISGEEIWFNLIRKGNGDEITIHFQGKVEGETMRLQMQFGRRKPVEMTAKRGTVKSGL
jgi:hypothetical protein